MKAKLIKVQENKTWSFKGNTFTVFHPATIFNLTDATCIDGKYLVYNGLNLFLVEPPQNGVLIKGKFLKAYFFGENKRADDSFVNINIGNLRIVEMKPNE